MSLLRNPTAAAKAHVSRRDGEPGRVRFFPGFLSQTCLDLQHETRYQYPASTYECTGCGALRPGGALPCRQRVAVRTCLGHKDVPTVDVLTTPMRSAYESPTYHAGALHGLYAV